MSACIRTPVRMLKAVIVAVLILSIALLVVRTHEGKQEADALGMVTKQIQDCDAWASMSVKLTRPHSLYHL